MTLLISRGAILEGVRKLGQGATYEIIKKLNKIPDKLDNWVSLPLIAFGHDRCVRLFALIQAGFIRVPFWVPNCLIYL